MQQKRLDNILYVYSLEPYVITKDTDADVIFVQEELFDEYKKLNPTLTQLAKKNYDILTVITPEWNLYRYLPDEQQDPEIPLNSQMSTIVSVNEGTDTITTNNDVQGFQMFEDGDVNPEYSSSNTNVATIDDTGYVEVQNPGTTVVGVHYDGDEKYNEYDKEYTIVVNDSGNNLIDPQISMAPNQSFHNEESLQLDVTNPYSLPLVYSTNTPNLSVDSNGIVTSNVDVDTESEPMKVYATFVGDNSFKAAQATSNITILEERLDAGFNWVYNGQPIDEFGIPVECALGEENTLPTLSNPNNLTITYSTNADPSVCTIDSNGNITLIGTTGANFVYISASFAGNDNYKPLETKYKLTIMATSKGYTFTTVRPTAESLPSLINLNGVKPTQSEAVDMTELEKPTDMYLVFPASWEVVEDDQIEKPIVSDDANGGEIGMWWDENNPHVTVNNIDYRIESIQLGKGSFHIQF